MVVVSIIGMHREPLGDRDQELAQMAGELLPAGLQRDARELSLDLQVLAERARSAAEASKIQSLSGWLARR